jgi:predicted ferric reductase
MDMSATQTHSTSIPSVSGTANLNTTVLPGSVAALVLLHAICLGGSFIILFPLGTSLLRFFNSFGLHWMLQIIATVICIIGLAVAVVLSVMGVEYDSFNIAHQVIGILVVAVLFFQIVLGHIGRTWASYAHLWTGRIAILAGMVNTVLYVIPLSHVPLNYHISVLKLEVQFHNLLTRRIGASSLPDQQAARLVRSYSLS